MGALVSQKLQLGVQETDTASQGPDELLVKKKARLEYSCRDANGLTDSASLFEPSWPCYYLQLTSVHII